MIQCIKLDMRRIAACHFTVICLLFTGGVCAQMNVAGLPDIKNYKRSDYRGGTQNWNIDQDRQGNLYFANNAGLLQFDGATWNKFDLPNHSYVRSVKVDDTGRIYVGGYNEFGYFSPNEKGALTYHSLASLLAEGSQRNIDFIWKIHLFKKEVVFQGFEQAYIYDGKTVIQLDAPNRFQFSFLVEDRLYFQDKQAGLFEYKDHVLIPLKATHALNGTEVWGILPFKDGQLLIATQNKGVFVYRDEGLAPWNSDANVFLKKHGCLGGKVVKGDAIEFNSVLNGIIICDTSGKIKQHIDQTTGLQNNTVLTSFIDSRNNLWLGLDNGIDYIHINSPLTYFGHSFNISTVYASVEYKKKLYVATNQGLFYQGTDPRSGSSTFTLVKGTTGQAWNIQVLGDQLFCSHNRGLLLISGYEAVKTLDNKGYWGLKNMPGHPDYFIGSYYNGFSVFEKKAGTWSFENNIEGFDKSSNIFEPYGDDIWIVRDDQLYQLKLNKDLTRFKSIKVYPRLADSVKGIAGVRFAGKTVYFQSDQRFFRFKPDAGVFIPDLKMSALFKDLPVIRFLHEDGDGNIWYVFDESLGVFKKKRDGSFTNILAPFADVKGNLPLDYLSVNQVDSQEVFIGLTTGLAHFKATASPIIAPAPVACIRSFLSPGDSAFWGNGGKESARIRNIPFKYNTVKFSFSSPIYENPESIEFSYRLEGFADRWSDWTPANSKEYTNLHEGDYKMYVRARNSAGAISEPVRLAFTVSPPFYRHPLAWFSYFMLAAFLVILLHYRIKSRIKRHKIHESVEQQKKYAERETRVKLEQVEMEKEIEKLKIERLQLNLLSKDRELVNNSLQVLKKNKLIKGILQKIKNINDKVVDEYTKGQLAILTRNIDKEVDNDKSWQELEKHIQSVHFDFLKRLKEKYPCLSSRDLDFSTCLLLNMSSKEIAEIMNISGPGVELARYRLRKKLGLNREENLVSFFMGI
jgi:DNA-binding CsgD family transcriptional regulator